MKFSVIIPTFNYGHFLSKSLASAVGQTLSPIEILVMNDGSFDDTQFVLDRFASRYHNIKIFRTPQNRGASAARNDLLELAQGEYVVFLDSDDSFADAMALERLYDAARDDAADMVLSHARRHYYDAGAVRQDVADEPEISLFPERLKGQTLESLPALARVHAFSCFIYRLNFLHQAGIRFDDPLPHREDRPFKLWASSEADNMSVLPRVTRIVRKHDDSSNLRRRRKARDVAFTENDLQLELRGLQIVHSRFADALQRRPGLAAAYPIVIQQSCFSIGRNILPVLTDQDRLEPISDVETYEQRLRELVREIFAGDSGQSTSTDDGADRPKLDDEYLRQLKEGRFGDAYKTFRTLRPNAVATIRHEAKAPNQLGRRLLPVDKPRIVLHIGLHRTGSTHLQNTLYHGRDRLLQNGVLFPESILVVPGTVGPAGAGRTSGHQGLIRLVNDAQATRQLFDAFNAEIETSRPNTIVISAENLSRQEISHKIHRVKELFEDCQVDVVCYLRRPAEWLESYYAERVAGGYIREQRAIGAMLVPDGEEWLQFDRRIEPWLAAFGTNHVHCRIYDKVLAEGGDTTGDFLAYLGLAHLRDAFDKPEQRSNKSYDRGWIEIIRLFNCINHDSPTYDNDHADLLRALAIAEVPHDPQDLLSPDSRATLVDRWKPTGARLRELGLITDDDLELLTTTAAPNKQWTPLSEIPVAALNLIFLYSRDRAADVAGPVADATSPGSAQGAASSIRMANLSNTNQRLRERIQLLRDRNEHMNRQEQRLKGSWSWRLTRPLRKLDFRKRAARKTG